MLAHTIIYFSLQLISSSQSFQGPWLGSHPLNYTSPPPPVLSYRWKIKCPLPTVSQFILGSMKI